MTVILDEIMSMKQANKDRNTNLWAVEEILWKTKFNNKVAKAKKKENQQWPSSFTKKAIPKTLPFNHKTRN